MQTCKIIITLLIALNSLLSQAVVLSINSSEDLTHHLRLAKPGDQLNVSAGTYVGNFTITESVSIHCQPKVIIDANNKGDAIRIKAANVTIKNCRIANWGNNLTEMNAGIFAEKNAENLTLDNNQLHGDSFGIWIDSAKAVTISNNTVEGNLAVRSQDRGNGIHLFNVTQALVKNNQVWHTRDGIYIDTSNNNQLIGNHLHHLRYGIHYMYSYNNLIQNNRTNHTRTGYALMQSKYLTVINNRSDFDSNYGILLNYIVHSRVIGNQVSQVHQAQGAGKSSVIKGAEGKAIFMYNAPFNLIENNLLQQSDIAIHLTAGSEDNKIFGNYFVRNKQQVKYVSNREVEWSEHQRGNFWSDYQGWDSNADGIGDEAFEPNDGMDKILWKYPAANVLINSPAVQTLRWAQKTFPVLKSPGIKDSFPLMKNDFNQSNPTLAEIP